MMELGELEKHHEEFARRKTRVVAVSLEDPKEAARTQENFPHLTVVADAEKQLLSAAGALHAQAGPGKSDTAVPTTIAVDRVGMVRWFFRPDSFLARLPPEDLLEALDKHLAGE
jgi:peroxiredoxin